MTAEGVETEAEATLLRLAGCGWMQGFYFARPSPAATIAVLLGAQAARHAVAHQGGELSDATGGSSR